MDNQKIIDACRKFGAKSVSDAAYAAMNGRSAAINSVELGELRSPAALYKATTLAYDLLSPEDQADDLCQAIIDASKLT